MPQSKTFRIQSIDTLRGIVMLLMLVDHAREFFYMHAQVTDPVDLSVTPPELFFTRFAAHLCAPVFVGLTGLAAWLYGNSRGNPRDASGFLLKRGLFLVFLELTFVNFGWTFSLNPSTFYLQVIWAIGLSMIALSVLLKLPRSFLLWTGAGIILGHNLLDPIAFLPGEWGHDLWAILHDRSFIELPWGARARTSYPILPWIGVISLGYTIGPWFSSSTDKLTRGRKLLVSGAALLLLFSTLRALNIYGEPAPWVANENLLLSTMSFLNLTKYPPSADFLLLTLGIGLLLLFVTERIPALIARILSVFGSAPLFFYLLHIYLLHLLQIGTSDRVPGVTWLWGIALMMAVPLWVLCHKFSSYKKRKGSAWLSYL